jgi:hypothetical protein
VGIPVGRDDAIDDYHSLDDRYYGATRKFVMETMVQERWTPQSPQGSPQGSPQSLQSYAEDPVVQALNGGASDPIMPW